MDRTKIVATLIIVGATFSTMAGVSPVLLQPDLFCEDLGGADGMRGYSDGDQDLAEHCYLVICETEWGADGVYGYSENDVWFAAACYSGTSGAGISAIDTIGIEWSDGVFSMLTIMAGLIMLTSGARLVYVDAQYEKIIDKHRDNVDSMDSELGKKKDKDEEKAFLIESMNQRNLLSAMEDKREDNRRNGILWDVIGISGIIIFGFLTASGIFDDVAPMIGLSAVFAVATVVHFLRHLRIVIAGTGRNSL